MVQHRVRLKPGTKPYAVQEQKRYSPRQEWWLRKLVLEGLEGGIYERTLVANGRLSDWNGRIVLVEKFDDGKLLDEPRVAFDFSQVLEDLPASNIELGGRIHDYIADPRHRVFM